MDNHPLPRMTNQWHTKWKEEKHSKAVNGPGIGDREGVLCRGQMASTQSTCGHSFIALSYFPHPGEVQKRGLQLQPQLFCASTPMSMNELYSAALGSLDEYHITKSGR